MNTVDLVLLVLAVIGLTILMRGTFRRVTRVTSEPRHTARAEFARLEEERQARHDAEEVMLELNQVAREIQGQLDTRFAKLEVILRDADARIEELRVLLRDSREGRSLDLTISDVENPAAAEQRGSESAKGPHDQIYHLADSGASGMEIARATGKTVGEIDLILALRRTRRESSADRSASSNGERAGIAGL